MTKKQKQAKARKRSVERRVSAALKKFLQLKNPGRKPPSHVRVKRNRGGSITITPVRVPKR